MIDTHHAHAHDFSRYSGKSGGEDAVLRQNESVIGSVAQQGEQFAQPSQEVEPDKGKLPGRHKGCAEAGNNKATRLRSNALSEILKLPDILCDRIDTG